MIWLDSFQANQFFSDNSASLLCSMPSQLQITKEHHVAFRALKNIATIVWIFIHLNWSIFAPILQSILIIGWLYRNLSNFC